LRLNYYGLGVQYGSDPLTFIVIASGWDATRHAAFASAMNAYLSSF
jgi:hypothetical protein